MTSSSLPSSRRSLADEVMLYLALARRLLVVALTVGENELSEASEYPSFVPNPNADANGSNVQSVVMSIRSVLCGRSVECTSVRARSKI